MKKPTIKEISESLKYLIEQRAKEIVSAQTQNEDTLGDLVIELRNLINEAKAQKEDFSSHSLLTINQVESEGYLRAALTIEGILKDLKLDKYA